MTGIQHISIHILILYLLENHYNIYLSINNRSMTYNIDYIEAKAGRFGRPGP